MTECTRCGRCCTANPTQDPWYDVELFIMDELRIPLMLHVNRRGGPDQTITNWMRRKQDGSCVAYQEGAGCTIYAIRPSECRKAVQPGDTRCQALQPNS